MFNKFFNARSITHAVKLSTEINRSYSNANINIHENRCDIVKNNKYIIDINFNEHIMKEWRKNENCYSDYKHFEYRNCCIYKFKNGHICGKQTIDDSEYCGVHLARIILDNKIINFMKKYFNK